MSDSLIHPNGAQSHYSRFPFRSLVRVTRCPCEDGAQRTAFVTGEANSFDCILAYVNAGGRRVRGFITSQGYPFARDGLRFVAYGRPDWYAAWRDARVTAQMADKSLSVARTPARRLFYAFPADFL